MDISSNDDFLIKRDNPLFSSSNSPPAEVVDSKSDQIPATKLKATSAEDTRRGRTVSRNADAGEPTSGIGRSLSRVDAGRRHRSVSRHPVARGQYGNSESEVEQEDCLLVNYKGGNNLNTTANNGKKSGLVRSSSDMLDQMKCWRTPSDQSFAFQFPEGSTTNLSYLRTPDREDGVSTNSFSEAEEKTIKAVCEQMKSRQGDRLGGDASAGGIYETVRSEVRRAISDIQNDLENAMRRTNTTAIASASVTDIPPDLVSPGAVELVSDIRREYAKKLEQSQERARKLREDLEIEEHRQLELSRILKEVLPVPKTSNVPKSRPGRKSSIERRKMSKRLNEEAMAYFDECVSLSTFDSSDFSSPEDPSLDTVASTPAIGSAALPRASSIMSATYSPNSCLDDDQEDWFTRGQDAVDLTASSSSKEQPQAQESLMSSDKILGRKFSFSCRPSESVEFQEDIMKYVRNFEKGMEKVNLNAQTVTRNHYDLDEYNLGASQQNLLFDRVFFKNRIEFGSLLLCGGGIAFSSSHFASIM